MHRLSDIKVTSRRYIACKLLKSRFLVIFQKKENREKSGNFKNQMKQMLPCLSKKCCHVAMLPEIFFRNVCLLVGYYPRKVENGVDVGSDVGADRAPTSQLKTAWMSDPMRGPVEHPFH